MQKALLLDLDRTLFDTANFMQQLTQKLPSICSSSQTEIKSIFDHYNRNSGTLLHQMDFEAIFSDLGITYEAFEKFATGQFKQDQFVYADAKDLVDWAKRQTAYSTMIVSFGADNIQKLKLSLCPSLQWLPVKIIQLKKSDYILKEFVDVMGALVDDKFGQDLPNGWIEIHIDRNTTDKYAPCKLGENVWRIVDLKDVKGLL